MTGQLTVTYGYHVEDGDCPGDADSSGWVEFDDLLFVLSFWGMCPEDTPCTGDLDDSGEVGLTDLLTILSNWGACPE